MDTQTLITLSTIISPIISVIAIIVALWISRNSSKDILDLIKTNKLESSKQIKQLQFLAQSFFIAILHNLEEKNMENNIKSKKVKQEMSLLFDRLEKIRNWKINDENNPNVDNINSHFDELHEIVSSMMNLKEQSLIYNDIASSISKTLKSLEKPINEYCNSK